jgi:hypothetical protein
MVHLKYDTRTDKLADVHIWLVYGKTAGYSLSTQEQFLLLGHLPKKPSVGDENQWLQGRNIGYL